MEGFIDLWGDASEKSPFFSRPSPALGAHCFVLGSGPPLEAPDHLSTHLLFLLNLLWEDTSPTQPVNQVWGIQLWTGPWEEQNRVSDQDNGV